MPRRKRHKPSHVQAVQSLVGVGIAVNRINRIFEITKADPTVIEEAANRSLVGAGVALPASVARHDGIVLANGKQ